jgi:hypothetical protein
VYAKPTLGTLIGSRIHPFLHLFGKGNELDPGPVPSFLPTLTVVEELLIARIYIHLQVVRIRGQQYRYTGHITCFG